VAAIDGPNGGGRRDAGLPREVTGMCRASRVLARDSVATQPHVSLGSIVTSECPSGGAKPERAGLPVDVSGYAFGPGAFENHCEAQGVSDKLLAMSQTIYARVPDHIKEAADEYAGAQGTTLAGAVADLLDRGLQAAGNEKSVVELKQRATALAAEVERLQQRDNVVTSAYAALAQRIAQPVGACPVCGDRLSGRDLLVAGCCPNSACGASVSGLLGGRPETQTSKGGLDDGDVKLLLGALGLLLGIAFISQQGVGGG
jgi:hypothetical protein